MVSLVFIVLAWCVYRLYNMHLQGISNSMQALLMVILFFLFYLCLFTTTFNVWGLSFKLSGPPCSPTSYVFHHQWDSMWHWNQNCAAVTCHCSVLQGSKFLVDQEGVWNDCFWKACTLETSMFLPSLQLSTLFPGQGYPKIAHGSALSSAFYVPLWPTCTLC